MTWQVVSRPEAENDVIEIAAWYDSHCEGLGSKFVEEFLTVLDELTTNPLLHCRRHPRKNIRWHYPKSFPYRVIHEVVEQQEDGYRGRCPPRRAARSTVEATSLSVMTRELVMRRSGRLG